MNVHLIDLVRNSTITFSKLLFTHYKELGLSDSQFLLFLHLQLFAEEGKTFPSIHELEKRMSLPASSILTQIEALIKAGFIQLEKDLDQWGKISERFELTPLYQRLSSILTGDSKISEKDSIQESNIFSLFETTFGRPLSPYECEYLSQWVDKDQYDLVLIQTALNEASIVGKLNIRYIDRILFEWSKQNITTEEEAKNFSMRFREKQYERMDQRKQKDVKDQPRFPQFNWLKNQSK